MPEPSETGVFMERRSYRRRRLIDGLKLLPFLGIWLFLLPVFWPGDDSGAPQSMSGALYFIFGVWFALILACAVLVIAIRWLGSPDEGGPPDTDDAESGEARRP